MAHRNAFGASPKGRIISSKMIILFVLWGLSCFYVGLLVGSMVTPSSTSSSSYPSEQELHKLVKQRVKEQIQRITKQRLEQETSQTDGIGQSRFPLTISDIVEAAIIVDRDDFIRTFDDLGVPWDKTTEGNSQVLLLYNSKAALPDNAYIATEAQALTTPIPALLSAEEATQNCDFLHVILTDHTPSTKGQARKQCTALVGQYESFHIQKYMRLPHESLSDTPFSIVTANDTHPTEEAATASKRLDSSLPLRYVNRGATPSGRKSTNLPSWGFTQHYWQLLITYLQHFETIVSQELHPIVQAMATRNNPPQANSDQLTNGSDKTIIVLVCNFGQSELLLNFLCNAKARKLDLSNILVFCMDMETYNLAKGLGVAAFYDAINLGPMPKEAASRYGDRVFRTIMLSKVFCVQMTLMLGYNVLFQDVDVIWYQHPFSYFHDPSKSDPNVDMFFQDDGNHAIYYAPYSANTGFYYVRNNERTRHFFNTLLMAGDLILENKSHQAPLIALLNEHASLHGLRVKILSRDGNDFPGGHSFHRRRPFMKDLIAGAVTPYIFHMSWTTNKNIKRQYFQQLGEWYVHEDVCLQKTAQQILGLDTNATVESSSLIQPCCSAEPIISCHYRDKPSKLPCSDSPTIDKNGRPFW